MREKCVQCGDKLFKIVNGKIICRKGHVKGIHVKKTQEVKK